MVHKTAERGCGGEEGTGGTRKGERSLVWNLPITQARFTPSPHLTAPYTCSEHKPQVSLSNLGSASTEGPLFYPTQPLLPPLILLHLRRPLLFR